MKMWIVSLCDDSVDVGYIADVSEILSPYSRWGD